MTAGSVSLFGTTADPRCSCTSPHLRDVGHAHRLAHPWQSLGGSNNDSRAIDIEMKTLGIIGGIAPESTVDYYRQIIALYRSQQSDGGYPSILINSINLKKMLDLIGAGNLPEVTEYLLSEVVKLAAAGADFGLFASNTPHLVFEDIRQRSPIPLVSIVEATCEVALALGLGKVGLLGTRFTMQGGFYPKVFSTHRKS